MIPENTMNYTQAPISRPPARITLEELYLRRSRR